MIVLSKNTTPYHFLKTNSIKRMVPHQLQILCPLKKCYHFFKTNSITEFTTTYNRTTSLTKPDSTNLCIATHLGPLEMEQFDALQLTDGGCYIAGFEALQLDS
jgi:hypothetical protein